MSVPHTYWRQYNIFKLLTAKWKFRFFCLNNTITHKGEILTMPSFKPVIPDACVYTLWVVFNVYDTTKYRFLWTFLSLQRLYITV